MHNDETKLITIYAKGKKKKSMNMNAESSFHQCWINYPTPGRSQ